jgi:hypothetical protein
MTNAIDPLDGVLRQAFCGHAWLLDRLVRGFALTGDPLQERLFSSRDFAEDCARLAAGRMNEADPFLIKPPAPTPDTAGWFDLGFSALLLELVTLHAQPQDAQGTDENTNYGMLAEHFRSERRFALNLAAAEGEASVNERINAFVIPAVESWGELFLHEVFDTLYERLPHRHILNEAIVALKEAGLPDDPWLYIEPQLDRYKKSFGIGVIKKKLIKLSLWLA